MLLELRGALGCGIALALSLGAGCAPAGDGGTPADARSPGDPGTGDHSVAGDRSLGGDAGDFDGGGDEAAPCAGTWAAPCEIFWPLPAVVSGDTFLSAERVVDAYSPCAPGIDEGGAEVVYLFEPKEDGLLVATLDDTPGDDVDVDVHLLRAPSADACETRGNVSVTASLVAEQAIWVVVDTWINGNGEELAGPYRLTLTWFPTGGCPADMTRVSGDGLDLCMDLYEAPNLPGELPLVMYTFDESQQWCAARGKRLCFDDEWTLACAGPNDLAYPYGDTYDDTKCNTDKAWLTYDQPRLNNWPAAANGADVMSLTELLAAARAVSTAAADAADHVEELYQGEGGGEHPECTNAWGAFDAAGNVEEWTRRRDGGDGADFSGNLKGRYWAEPRPCQSGVTSHGNAFRFYEIGFRCCLDVH